MDADIYLVANVDVDVYENVLFITTADADGEMNVKKKICGWSIYADADIYYISITYQKKKIMKVYNLQ